MLIKNALMTFKHLSSWLMLAAILLPCMNAPGQQNALRDEAAGTKASLAEPVAGELLDPSSHEEVFLEEFMNYEMKLLKNWKLRVSATGGWRHDSNIFLSQNNPESDMMWSARPGFQYTYGDEQARLQFLADYGTQFNFFERNAAQNSVNQFLSLSMALRMKKTSIKLAGRFSDVSGGDLDVGGQAQRVQFTPELVLQYELTEKVRVGITGQLQQSSYEALLSSTTWRVGLFADYAFSPQLRLGLQFNEMVQEVDQSGRQTGQDYLVRVEWEAMKKLSVTGNAGVHVLTTASGNQALLPAGSLGVKYDIRPKTSITAAITARAQNSPSLVGEYFQSVGAVVGVQQQLGSKMNLGADLGYDFSEYGSYLAGVASTRADHTIFARPWLRYALHRHLSLELFYQYTSNDSSGTGSRGFERSLVGAGVTSSW